MTTTYVPPDGGVHHMMLDGDHVAKASVRGPDGDFEVFEVRSTAGQAAPPHVSPWTGVLYVLDGTVTASVDGTTYRVPRGGVLTMPAGVPSTFSVEDGTARFLAITSGDRAGRFFADVAATVPADGPVDAILTSLAAVTARHGVTVGPA